MDNTENKHEKFLEDQVNAAKLATKVKEEDAVSIVALDAMHFAFRHAEMTGTTDLNIILENYKKIKKTLEK